MDKEETYQLIKKEALKRQCTFIPRKEGANYGFEISKDDAIVYGSVYSNGMDKDIYQGISRKTYKFYNSNQRNNLVVLVDRKTNHFLVIPFDIMKKDFFPRQSKDIHYDFNISRNPYTLQRSGTDLSKYQDNLDVLFQSINSKINTNAVSQSTEQETEKNQSLHCFPWVPKVLLFPKKKFFICLLTPI